jgi:hypothetical protein
MEGALTIRSLAAPRPSLLLPDSLRLGADEGKLVYGHLCLFLAGAFAGDDGQWFVLPFKDVPGSL